MNRPLLFGDLFFGLRQAGIDVSFKEWMVLMRSLSEGIVEPDLTEFYYVARAILVKDETDFDTWDQVFGAVFREGEMPLEIKEDLLDWLEHAKDLPDLSPEQVAALERLPIDELRKLFEERLLEQQERHDGGGRWIGTGGTSPFGHSGINPAGVRIGGPGRRRSAIQIAHERRFRDYRDDRVLDTRSLGVALKKLRRLSRGDGAPELDVEATIDETCKAAGELELVFRPPRKNDSRVLLLMDVGGSMEPFARHVETLFSAASRLDHWKDFKAYQFHNCPYEKVYSSISRKEGVLTRDLIRDLPSDTSLIIVGDASMAPTELTARYGAIDYWHRNETPGVEWLKMLRNHFKRTIWLNPLNERWWSGWSIWVVQHIFPMYPLTVSGISDAVDCLLGRSEPNYPSKDKVAPSPF